jgi:hypothetical protein
MPDSMQIKRSPLQILASLGDRVAEKHFWRLDAGVGGGDCCPDLDDQRSIPVDNEDGIDGCNQKEGDRRDQAEREEDVFGARAAVSCLGELRLRRLGAEPRREFERVDQLFDDSARLHPQRRLRLRQAQSFALANADALTLRADRLDSARQRIGLQPRRRKRDHRRGQTSGREQKSQGMRVRYFGLDEIPHGSFSAQMSKVIIFFIIATPTAIQQIAIPAIMRPWVVIHRSET